MDIGDAILVNNSIGSNCSDYSIGDTVGSIKIRATRGVEYDIGDTISVWDKKIGVKTYEPYITIDGEYPRLRFNSKGIPYISHSGGLSYCPKGEWITISIPNYGTFSLISDVPTCTTMEHGHVYIHQYVGSSWNIVETINYTTKNLQTVDSSEVVLSGGVMHVGFYETETDYIYHLTAKKTGGSWDIHGSLGVGFYGYWGGYGPYGLCAVNTNFGDNSSWCSLRYSGDAMRTWVAVNISGLPEEYSGSQEPNTFTINSRDPFSITSTTSGNIVYLALGQSASQHSCKDIGVITLTKSDPVCIKSGETIAVTRGSTQYTVTSRHSICLDPNGVPFIIYTEQTPGVFGDNSFTSYVKYTYKLGDNWVSPITLAEKTALWNYLTTTPELYPYRWVDMKVTSKYLYVVYDESHSIFPGTGQITYKRFKNPLS